MSQWRVRLVIPRILRHITVRMHVHGGFSRIHVPRTDGRTQGGRGHGVGHAINRRTRLRHHTATGLIRRRRMRFRVSVRRRLRRRCRIRLLQAAAALSIRWAAGARIWRRLLLSLQHLLVLGTTILKPDFHLIDGGFRFVSIFISPWLINIFASRYIENDRQ